MRYSKTIIIHRVWIDDTLLTAQCKTGFCENSSFQKILKSQYYNVLSLQLYSIVVFFMNNICVSIFEQSSSFIWSDERRNWCISSIKIGKLSILQSKFIEVEFF